MVILSPSFLFLPFQAWLVLVFVHLLAALYCTPESALQCFLNQFFTYSAFVFASALIVLRV